MGRHPRPSGLELSESEILGQLGQRGWNAGLLLGRFSSEEVERVCERSGLLARMRELGYAKPELHLAREQDVDILRIRVLGEAEPLMDLRLGEESRLAPAWSHPHLGEAPISVLVVQWVSVQHPRGRFGPDRKPFPGQKLPGLGLGRRLYRMLWRWARELGKEGLSAYPLYYHNAVYYSAGFAYLDPREQGRFRAMERDLASVGLRVASESIQDGQLVDKSGSRFDWKPGEMFAPAAARLSDYFKSDFYRDQTIHWTKASSFRLR